MSRMAILLDDNGQEIWRGLPANMPVRFVSDDKSFTVVATMADVAEIGVPIDVNTGNDLSIHDGDSE